MGSQTGKQLQMAGAEKEEALALIMADVVEQRWANAADIFPHAFFRILKLFTSAAFTPLMNLHPTDIERADGNVYLKQ